jgi:hypothetical protein
MALASLKGREELEENRVHPTSNTLMTIVKCLEMAMKKDKKMYGGVMWTVSMVLQPLYELSIADTHKVEMVVSGVAVPLLRSDSATARTDPCIRLWTQHQIAMWSPPMPTHALLIT